MAAEMETDELTALVTRCEVLGQEFEQMWASYDALPWWKKAIRPWGFLGTLRRAERNLRQRQYILTQIASRQ